MAQGCPIPGARSGGTPKRGRHETLVVDGASRARTGDLLHAMQALSQLSYGPWVERESIDEAFGKAYAVTAWSSTEGMSPQSSSSP